MNIWQKLPKPILILAPMEDVTDTVFRRIIASCAKPDIFFTEFTNADGLVSEGRDIVSQRLTFTEDERPIVAQLWGKKPESFYLAAKLIAKKKFDGIDINFGCPERAVVKNGCCAAMIGNEKVVSAIMDAVKQGIADSKNPIPISVKTRLGYKSYSADWIPFLLEQQIDAITIHGRTATEMSAVPVHWDEIAKAVRIRDGMGAKTLIIGNGDVRNATEAMEKVNQYGVDGIMMGRAVFENLWAFKKGDRHRSTIREHLEIMKKHVELFEKTWGKTKNYAMLRKFFKIYVKGFEGASDWREKVMTTKSPEEVYPIIEEMMKMLQ